MSDWNAGIIEEFRANDGVVGGMFEGKPLLILHTIGARTGARREHPLMYLERDGRLFVFASKAGAHTHPDWYYNAKANPSVSIEIGTEKLDKTATELDRNHRDEIYSHQAGLFEQFAEYQAGTERVIPVIELT
ncbi:MAG: nitroreductase family deazaflavin-dependent oxidoreductase [Actinomycetota bacterium]